MPSTRAFQRRAPVQHRRARCAGSLPTPTAVTGWGVFYLRLSVCLFFRTMSQKRTQLGSPNFAYKCAKMSPGNPFILRSQGQMSRSLVTKKHCRRGSLHSCECCLLLVAVVFLSSSVKVCSTNM